MIRVNSQSFSLSSTLKKKNYDIQPVVQQNIANAQSYSNAPSPYTSPASHSGAAKSHGGDHLGLQYVTERILASVLPARQRPTTPDNGNSHEGGHDDDDGHVQLRRPPTAASSSSGDENGDGSAGDHYERELVQMLEQKHGKNYKLFDLESCIATVTLERLCELCKHMDAWLGAGREKVVVLQDRGQKQRLGAAIAAYLEYLDICATTTPSGAGGDAANPAIARNWLNLDIFSMKKFLDDVIGPLRVPSHRRYLQYFAGLLSGQIKMNAAPLYLRYVSVDAPPTWLTYDAAVLAANGHRDAAAAAAASAEWRTFVKVYEGLHCVFTSAVHVVPVSTRQFVFEMTGGGGGSGTALRLRGDVIVRCYHIVPSVRVYQERRELIWSAQFHTCACTERTIGFGRAELDYACDDPRFPSDHQITLHFEKTAQAADSAGFLFQSPLVKIEPVTSIAKYDSLENFDDASSQHTQGPLDGSLYATILKSPKTPERPASTFPFPQQHQQQQPAAQRQSAALISPPPEFSNTNIAASSTPSTTVIPHHHHHHHHLQRSQSCTPQPHVHSNNNNNHSSTLQRATYQTPTPPRSSSSQSHYHNFQPPQQQQQQRSVSRASNGHTNGHHSADAAHALERGQSIRYAQPAATASGATNGGSGNSPAAAAAAVAGASADQRRISSGALSVHSPLTLSMDSGIASSGVTTTTTTATHRRVQGSSVSPSSFPSQASPQEDRDRELDDILSDMLQTVKDIPDMANKSGTLKSSAGSGHKNPQNLKIHLTPSPPHHQQHHSSATSSSTTSYYQNAGADYNTDTIKRSPKTQQQQQQLQQQQHQSPVAIDHDQFYETSSTTTTITPPASESGRDTPQQQHHRTSTLSLHSQRDSDRSQYQNLTTVHRQQQQQQHQQQHTLQPSNGGGSRTHHHHHSNNHQHHQQQQQQHGRSDAHHTTSAAQSQSYVYQTQTQHNPQQPRCDSAASTAAYSIVLPSDDTGDDTDDTTDTRSHRSSSTRASHSIPYHAREDSRPFTYGHAAGVQLQSVSEHAAEPSAASASSSSGVAAQGTGTGTGMLKMQSGLSSPSLVRRTLQPVQPQQHKVRNDFEEMLKQRREKVMQDTGGKYTIGDRATAPANGAATSSSTNSSYDHHVKWGAEPSAAAASSGIGYPYEPLRRSNTMDGGFGRSHSSDGSGPTWLQLQQQKLRAKKQLQTRPGDERVHFVERTATIGASRPHRSRSSTGRYDGYASDTAAFDTATGAFDEVDYRRPLHVQTPGRQSGGYSLHSSQTMLAHPQTERPFVAVRRAHALHSNGSAQPPLSPLSALYAAPLGQVVQQPTPAASARNGNGNLLLSVASSSDANNNNTISSTTTTTATTTMNGGSLNGGNGGGSGGNSPASRPNGHTRLVREESFSSYRSETDPETSLAGSPRPETPAFPVTPRTPYGLNGNGLPSPALPPKSPNTVRKDIYAGGAQLNNNVHFINQNDSMSCYASRRNSNSSTANSEPQDVPSHLVKFVRDSSQFWYKPTISRDEAVALLRHAPPGTFIVRDSTTFAKAYGLVLKVAFPPAGIPARSGPNSDELVRHFLVEPTTRGVRLKGCANEPVFTSLSALVYQHSITPLALPTRLLIPDHEAAYGIEALQQQQLHTPAQQQLLAQGAACNVLYLLTVDTESLTGPEAVRKAVSLLFGRKPLPVPTTVHFKVAQQGVTLTDNTRQLFFRKHYPAANISHCGLDPEDRRWSIRSAGDVPVANKALFAFVARRSGSAHDNQCHVFCELEPTQPATAITSFANKVVPGIGNTPARNF